VNCHGDIDNYATLKTSGPAAPDGGTNLACYRTPWGTLRFHSENGKLYHAQWSPAAHPEA
jgi:hypothetical protein